MRSLLNLGLVFHICHHRVFADQFFTHENIKNIVIALLLSPKLQAYKGDAPKDGVLIRELPLSLILYLIIQTESRGLHFC